MIFEHKDSDSVQGFLMMLVIVIVFVYGYKQSEKNHQADEVDPELADSGQLEDEISDLYSRMNALKDWDELIIDLRLCKPAAMQKIFHMEWMSTSGQSHALEFMTDGQNTSTEYLLRLATAERDAINEDIQKRINLLYHKMHYIDYSD